MPETKIHKLVSVNRFYMSSGEECEILIEDIMELCKKDFIVVQENVWVQESGREPIMAELVFTWEKTCGFVMFFYRRDGKLFCRRTYEYRHAKENALLN